MQHDEVCISYFSFICVCITVSAPCESDTKHKQCRGLDKCWASVCCHHADRLELWSSTGEINHSWVTVCRCIVHSTRVPVRGNNKQHGAQAHMHQQSQPLTTASVFAGSSPDPPLHFIIIIVHCCYIFCLPTLQNSFPVPDDWAGGPPPTQFWCWSCAGRRGDFKL